MKYRKILFYVSASALVTALSFCSSNPANTSYNDDDRLPQLSGCTATSAALPDNAVVIEYSGVAAEVVKNPYNNLGTVVDGGHVTVNNGGAVSGGINIVLKGTTKNGSFKIDGGSRVGGGVKLYLNGVNITNPSGPAINIQTGGKNENKVSVHLVNDCDSKNFLEGRGIEADTSAKGAFFSEAEVEFLGSGSLEIRSKARHAIAVDNHFGLAGGNILIQESVGDGVHANRVTIAGGTLGIISVGDAIQSERDDDMKITGGVLNLWTTGSKSHGVACDSSDVEISGNAKLSITVLGKASKGIRSRRSVTIKGSPTIDIVTRGNILTDAASDDDDTTSSAAGVRANVNFYMLDGNIKIRSTGDNAKGINVDKNASITGGVVDISSVGHGIKVSGNLEITGGNVTSHSSSKKGIDCGGNLDISGNVSTDIKPQ